MRRPGARAVRMLEPMHGYQRRSKWVLRLGTRSYADCLQIAKTRQRSEADNTISQGVRYYEHNAATILATLYSV